MRSKDSVVLPNRTTFITQGPNCPKLPIRRMSLQNVVDAKNNRRWEINIGNILSQIQCAAIKVICVCLNYVSANVLVIKTSCCHVSRSSTLTTGWSLSHSAMVRK